MICIDLGTHTTKALAFSDDNTAIKEILSCEVLTLQTSLLLQKDDQCFCGINANAHLSVDNALSYSAGFSKYLGSDWPLALTDFKDEFQYFSSRDLILRFFLELRNIWERKGYSAKDLSSITLSFPASYTPSMISRLHEVAEMSGFSKIFLLPEGEASGCYSSQIYKNKSRLGKTVLIIDWGWESLRLYLLNKDSWGRYSLSDCFAIVPEIGNQIITYGLMCSFMEEAGVSDDTLCDDPLLCSHIQQQIEDGITQLPRRNGISIKIKTTSARYLCLITPDQCRDVIIHAAQKVKAQIERFLSEIPSAMIPRRAILTGGGGQCPIANDFIATSLPCLEFVSDETRNTDAVIRGLGIHFLTHPFEEFYHEQYV